MINNIPQRLMKFNTGFYILLILTLFSCNEAEKETNANQETVPLISFVDPFIGTEWAWTYLPGSYKSFWYDTAESG
ncbi:hypothetical protein LZ575_20270 [Antarcticibacterium sp. 1MA-6-2]|uniref:hypothetical protein n=1 Tax=Antarcticibacterium sp. 1MA-6-2 TaxID=2908210 RepID=UPI001F250C8B|nr:hypothetical protein [Antarcticibacterium sp. 1MA-6-2]UJH90985.1 hypothetical protein LZ575_20270 [Antarcticibacterium sp. 1MA-6-2]